MNSLRTRLAHLALLAVAVFYSGNYLISQDIMRSTEISPLSLMFFRVFGAGALFWVFHSITIREKIKRKDIFYFILCSLIGIFLAQNTFLFGLEKTSTINASLIISTTPILVLIFSVLILKQKILWNNILGLFIAFAGVIILILNSTAGDLSLNENYRIGNLLILSNALCFGLYLVLVKNLLTKYHPLTVIKWIFSFSAPLILLVSYRDLVHLDWNILKGSTLLAVAYVVLFASFGTYALNVFAIKILSPYIAGLYLYIQPVLTTILSILLGKDQLDTVKIISGVLILSGLYISVFYRKSKSSQEK